jgi:hypothetical protein
LIVETAMSWISDRAVLVLNSEEQQAMEVSTYWMPTASALKGMARLCHFEVLGGRWQPDIGRGGVLGRAAPAATPAPGANTLTRAMHEHGLLDYEFGRLLAAADAAPPSAIAFKGEKRETEIKSATYTPEFPFHAHRPDPRTAIGLRDWATAPSD